MPELLEPVTLFAPMSRMVAPCSQAMPGEVIPDLALMVALLSVTAAPAAMRTFTLAESVPVSVIPSMAVQSRVRAPRFTVMLADAVS